VNASDLRKIFEAARWAPSSHNEQRRRFIVGLSGSDAYAKILSSLMEFNQLWAGKGPVLILDVASKNFARNNAPNGFNIFDLGAATGFLTLQAAELGLSTHQMAGYDKEKARQAFGIPEDYDLGSVVALGYQGEPSALTHQMMLSQETAPRTRKPLSDIVLSAWGESASLS
jgi:nitroreductase